MNIVMPRGDRRVVSFTIKEDGVESSIEWDEIYATFKSSYMHKKVLFQKRLTDGTIEKEDEGLYSFCIEPEDTDSLSFGDYVFDIELILGNDIKQTFVGEFVLTPEVTFAENE